MARMRRGLVVGMALFGLSGLTPGAAETVPLPGAAPQPKQGTPRPNLPATTAAQPQNPLSDLASGLRSLFHLDKQPEGPLAAATTAAFSPAQRAQVDKMSAYLSSVHQMHAHFVQVAPDGSQSQGEFYVQKPGRVRFKYDPPSPLEIIADGKSLVVRDRKLGTQDVYPLAVAIWRIEVCPPIGTRDRAAWRTGGAPCGSRTAWKASVVNRASGWLGSGQPYTTAFSFPSP